MAKDTIILLGLSGRGDKDINTVAAALGIEV
jgi:tryptophan synthase beta subunit